ncbi:MAG: hypothetical protein QXX17_04625 [Conexivisphaerales archaeon]
MSLKIDGSSLSLALRDVEIALEKDDLDYLETSILSWNIPMQLSKEILNLVSSLIRFNVKKPRLGFFIAVTGIDKTGKETQLFNPANKPGVTPLIDHLRTSGYQVLGIRQPSYDTRFGKLVSCYLGRPVQDVQIDGTVDSDVAWILWSLDRAQHNEKVNLWLTLGKKHVVLSKRWTESNVVYQSVHGIDPRRVLSVEKRIVKQDATIILELPVKEVLVRLSTQRSDAYENASMLEKAAELYRNLETIFPHGKVYRVDADADLQTVNKRLLQLVDSILGES